jgi:hypothetical protein
MAHAVSREKRGICLYASVPTSTSESGLTGTKKFLQQYSGIHTAITSCVLQKEPIIVLQGVCSRSLYAACTGRMSSHSFSAPCFSASAAISSTSQLHDTYLPRNASAAFWLASQTQKPAASSGVSLGACA